MYEIKCIKSKITTLCLKYHSLSKIKNYLISYPCFRAAASRKEIKSANVYSGQAPS